jgi:hypothetical protein
MDGLKGGRKRLQRTVVFDRKNGRIERWEEATQKLNFRSLMVALNNKYFGSGRLQEHYYHMMKTTLICEQEQIHKLATLKCEFTRKCVHLDVLRHYPANNDTNLRIATFNVRTYKYLLLCM